MFWVAESMTRGLPTALPQVLAMAALNVVTSALVVLAVSPGAAGSPTQFSMVDQLPLTKEPPSQTWLAACADCTARRAAIDPAKMADLRVWEVLVVFMGGVLLGCGWMLLVGWDGKFLSAGPVRDAAHERSGVKRSFHGGGGKVVF